MDEPLNRKLFLHIDEFRYIMDRWRLDYNHYRSHSSLDYMAPAEFAAIYSHNTWTKDGGRPMLKTQSSEIKITIKTYP